MKICMGALFILGMTALSLGVCPAGWRYFDNNCYRFESRTLGNWEYARKKCIQRGGQLAVVDNSRLNAYLQEQAKFGGANVYWIGLSDIHKEGTYRWEGTGETVSFSDWAHNQPDNHKGHEDCTHLWKHTGYRWNDLPCNFKGGYICQKIVAACHHSKCC